MNKKVVVSFHIGNEKYNNFFICKFSFSVLEILTKFHFLLIRSLNRKEFHAILPERKKMNGILRRI